ncbi:MAG: hypothetical protein GC155_04340 [Alphaproteobacteria bacterium]|nr:hypothetical protein [Alphaproteobacteria bacterium]
MKPTHLLVTAMAACWFAGAAALAAPPATPPSSTAPAAAGGLIDHYDEAAIREMVAQMGHKVVRTADQGDDRPFLVMETKTGELVAALATACHGDGPKRLCQGIQLIVDMVPPEDANAEGLVEEFNGTYAAAKFFYVDGKVRLSRYIILDDGITRKNFQANVDVMVEIADLVKKEMTSG